MHKLWLYLHFPQLQLDALLEQSHDTDKHAYVIFDESTNTICQLNRIAYSAGIRVGMGIATAAMLKADLQVLPYQPNITDNSLKYIAQHLYTVTSDICFFESNGLLLQVHNMLKLYGGLRPYWQIIQHQLESQQVKFHYATAFSPLAAKLLATTTWDTIDDDSLNIRQQLQLTSLQYSDLDPSVVQKLKKVGIHKVQDLLKIPLSDLAKRFTVDVATYLGRLTAELVQPVTFFHPPQSFNRYLELLYNIENTQILLTPLTHLLQSLEQYLKLRDLLTQTLQLSLYQQDKPTISLSIHSQQGEYLASTWLSLISLKLENIQLNSPVFAINLVVDNTYIRAPDEPDLFINKQGTLSHLQLVSLLQAKLGDEVVTRPTFNNDFRPEKVVTPNPSALCDTHQAILYALRPSFLLKDPQHLQEKVSIIYGPERIESGWWDSQNIIRDYFIARNTLGQWYWIFKTPIGEWYLHGVFS